eukprot:6181225-Pleurochrysis_carterae.AAC.3
MFARPWQCGLVFQLFELGVLLFGISVRRTRGRVPARARTCQRAAPWQPPLPAMTAAPAAPIRLLPRRTRSPSVCCTTSAQTLLAPRVFAETCASVDVARGFA